MDLPISHDIALWFYFWGAVWTPCYFMLNEELLDMECKIVMLSISSIFWPAVVFGWAQDELYKIIIDGWGEGR